MPDPADDRPLPGQESRLYRIGVMLLNGYGYNWYRLDNQMRADAASPVAGQRTP